MLKMVSATLFVIICMIDVTRVCYAKINTETVYIKAGESLSFPGHPNRQYSLTTTTIGIKTSSNGKDVIAIPNNIDSIIYDISVVAKCGPEEKNMFSKEATNTIICAKGDGLKVDFSGVVGHTYVGQLTIIEDDNKDEERKIQQSSSINDPQQYQEYVGNAAQLHESVFSLNVNQEENPFEQQDEESNLYRNIQQTLQQLNTYATQQFTCLKTGFNSKY